MSTIYDEIREDHQTHRDLLDRIAKTQGDSAERRDLWNAFYYDVKAHAAAEEETFYSKIMEKPDGQDDARHSVAEHKELDDIMEELNSMGFDNPGWLTRFRTLKHDYEHHMDEEEQDIFATAHRVLDDDGDGSYAARFLDRKSKERDLVDEKAEDALQD